MIKSDHNEYSLHFAGPKPRRALRWFGLIVGVLILSLVVLRVTQHQRTQTYLETIRKAGLPATLDDLQESYASPPNEENAALKILEAADTKIDPAPHVQANLPVVGKAKLPEAGAGLPPEMKQTIEGFLADNEAALKLLQEAALLKKSRYPMDLRLGPNTLLPHLARLKSLAQLLKIEAVYYSDQHQPDRAVRSVLTSFVIAASLREEPVMISQLVRVACLAITLSSLERILSENPLTEAQLAAVSDRLTEAEAAGEVSPLRALSGERCFGVHAFTASPRQLLALFGNPGNATTPNLFAQELQIAAFYAAKISGIWDRDQQFYLNVLGDLIAAARLPYPDKVTNSSAVMTRAEQQLASGRWLFISRMMLPAMSKFVDKEAAVAAQLRAARIALAVERFRLEHKNELPADLSQLVPKFLPKLPEDSFGHEPFQYERLDEGYRIISPGGTSRRGQSPSNKGMPPAPVGFKVER